MMISSQLAVNENHETSLMPKSDGYSAYFKLLEWLSIWRLQLATFQARVFDGFVLPLPSRRHVLLTIVRCC